MLIPMAGLRASFPAGLFLLRCTGHGDLWFNTYGAMIEIPVDELRGDTSHVVAFTGGLQYNGNPLAD